MKGESRKNEIKVKLAFYEIADNDYTGIIGTIFVNGLGNKFFSNFLASDYYPEEISQVEDFLEQVIWLNPENIFDFPSLEIATSVLTSNKDFFLIEKEVLDTWNSLKWFNFNSELESEK